MIDIQIEKGIPLPNKGRHPSAKYPFEIMEIGDSFEVTAEDCKQSGAINAARKWGKRNGVVFTTRRVKNTVRVWRVK